LASQIVILCYNYPNDFFWRLPLNTLELARHIVAFLEDKKAEDIVLMDIHGLSDIADYFVICSATSERMLDSLSEALAEHLKTELSISSRSEGVTGSGWTVLDVGAILVHLFSPDQRDYYRLEDLWHKGKVLIRLQ
jgi:ribosome-associated protein